ncbi:unnamed protein product, partial [Laminaria digitata]
MIRSFADAGVELAVMGLAAKSMGTRAWQGPAGIDWRPIAETDRPAWRSLPSPLPNLAYRCAVPAFREAAREALDTEKWDVVVIDSLSTGWALDEALALRRDRQTQGPRIVYLSHNHEETTRANVANAMRGNPLKRLALRADARKAARLERNLVRHADLVTAISPTDRTLYAAARNGRPLIELTPGYRGRRLPARQITPDTPRRVVLVGSFEWGAKQANLNDFVEIAAPAFKSAGIELAVVGKGGVFIEKLQQEYSDVRFTGRVDSIYEYLDTARIAVVPERLGGGFKLKALDYVFNRLPIAALENAFEGMPLVDRESVLAYPDLRALTNGLLAA